MLFLCRGTQLVHACILRHDLFVILVIPIWMNAVKAGTLKSHGNILVCVFLNCNTSDSMFSFHRSDLVCEFMNLV